MRTFAFVARLTLAALAGGFVSTVALAAAPAVTYTDMSARNPPSVHASGDEVIRLYVTGGGCRSGTHDIPPSVTGAVIDFTLTFSNVCFATPPGYRWTSDIGPLAAGTYTVNRFARTEIGVGTYTPGALVGTTTLTVGPRPEAPLPAKPGLADPSFGTDGATRVLESPARIGTSILGAQSSGRVIVGGQRLLDSGAIDGTFGVDGELQLDRTRIGLVQVLGANDEIVIAGLRNDAAATPAIFRFSPHGVMVGEIVIAPATPILGFPTAVTMQPDGSIVVALRSFGSCTGSSSWYAFRYSPNGAPDPAFGDGQGFIGPFLGGCVNRISPAPDGGVLLLGTNAEKAEQTFVMKLTSTGRVDTSFGQGGVVAGTFALRAPLVLEDGSILLGGSEFSLLKLRANGSPDTMFGTLGVIPNQSGMPLILQDFVSQPDGKPLLVGALLVTPGTPNIDYMDWLYQPVLVRYRTDGSLDPGFGNGGITKVDSLIRASYRGPAAAVSLLGLRGGNVLLASIESGTTNGFHVRSFQGDGGRSPVVEYFNVSLGHFFLSANPVEIDALDHSPPGGWVRTGLGFHAFATPPLGAMPVCRFYVPPGLGDSHYFSASPAECAAVKAIFPTLIFETDDAFTVDLPGPITGSCPAGSTPVYRLWNARADTNHRYTTSAAVRDQMLAGGYVAEGYGPDNVAMCAP